MYAAKDSRVKLKEKLITFMSSENDCLASIYNKNNFKPHFYKEVHFEN